jgi:hypothetical protein
MTPPQFTGGADNTAKLAGFNPSRVHWSRACDMLAGALIAAWLILGLTFVPGFEIRGQYTEPCGKTAEYLDGQRLASEQREQGGDQRAQQTGHFERVVSVFGSGHTPILTSSRGVSIT